MSRSQASASYAVGDSGGSIDDLGGGNTNDFGSYSSLATFTTTSPKTSASFVSPSLTIRASLLSISDKSTGDVLGNVDMDYATGSFCWSCSIPPPTAYGWWTLVFKGGPGGTLWTGKPQARNPTHKRKAERPLNQRRHWCAGVGCAMCAYVHGYGG